MTDAVWERAGGNDADLVTGKTGRLTWGRALQDVLAGRKGAPSLENLLATMLEDYPANQQLLRDPEDDDRERNPPMTSTDINVLVVTALKLERLAVREHLTDVETETASGLAAHIGTSVSSPGQRIAIIETGPGTSCRNPDREGRTEVSPRVHRHVRHRRRRQGCRYRRRCRLQQGLLGRGRQGSCQAPTGFAAVSPSVLQLARAVSADNAWMGRAKSGSGTWPGTGRAPESFVGPIVVGEKVVVDERAEVAQIISQAFSDAIAVDMEDFGALRGGAGR